jgi:hypothetical protein
MNVTVLFGWTAMSEKSKPLGVVLIALWSGLFGLASIPIGCTSAFVSGLPGAGPLFVLFGLAIMAMGVLLLASAYGLWTMQPWGCTLAWWIYLASIPLGVLAIFPIFPGQQMTGGNTVLQLIGIGIDLAVIAYLSDSELRALFRTNGATSESFEEYVRREPE